jgi:6-phosphogluconolactonase (cycloisomerase 2 family)
MNILKRLLWLSVFSSLMLCVALATETKAASFLYAINDNTAGNQIYGFSVNEATGALTVLPNFPVATGFNGGGFTSLEMIAIDRVNKRLYAINRGSNNISAYSINETTGALTLLPFSPIAGIPNERVVKVHPSGSPLIVGGDDVASYVITATSATPAAGSPYPAGTNVSPAGATFTRDGNYFYTGGNLGNFFAGFAVNSATGVLTALPGSPFDSGNQTPNPTATDATGRLFVINSRQALTRVYTTASGIPAQVTASPFANGLTSFASDGEVHPNGNFFMLADRTNNRVGVYQIAGSGAATTLTAIAGSPFATGGTSSIALAFNRTGNFLFVGNGTSRNFTTFSVSNATGALSSQTVQPANTLGSAGLINGIAYVNFSANFDAPVDFNGDGKSDYVVTRSVNETSPTTWLINYNGVTSGLSQTVQFGRGVGFTGGDIPVPEDYDGDGKDDVAVWRANPNGLGFFYILRSSDNTFLPIQFGQTGDDPTIVGDYDGDNQADVAVFRNPGLTPAAPCGASTVWYYRPSSAPGVDFRYFCWGSNGDRVAPGDYDGDGRNDNAVFRFMGNSGVFYVNKSGGGTDTVYWGSPGDQMMPGDYDGDGRTDYAVARQLNPREFYILTQTGATQFYQFGINTDVPVPGDYNGDGKTDIALFRPSISSFLIRPAQTAGDADISFKWGQPADQPAANYNFH